MGSELFPACILSHLGAMICTAEYSDRLTSFSSIAFTFLIIPYSSDEMLRYSAMTSPHVGGRVPTDPDMRAQLWTTPASKNPRTRPRLKVGLLSSDFGVHPVATLIRGFTQYIDRSRVELFCFALSEKRSWWGNNISNTVEHFINIASTNTQVGTAR